LTGTLSGFLAGDGVTVTYTRTVGETVANSPYTISATLSPASVLGNYTITSNTALFTINKRNASVTPAVASKTYGDADPTRPTLVRSAHRDAERLPGWGRRDGDLQPDRRRDGGRQPLHHQRDTDPSRRARQLQHHRQHRTVHHQQAERLGDPGGGE